MDLSIGIRFNDDVLEDAQFQYTTEGLRRLRTIPVVSNSMLYAPRPGSMRLFLEMG
jgi:hypothetical protein